MLHCLAFTSSTPNWLHCMFPRFEEVIEYGKLREREQGFPWLTKWTAKFHLLDLSRDCNKIVMEKEVIRFGSKYLGMTRILEGSKQQNKSKYQNKSINQLRGPLRDHLATESVRRERGCFLVVYKTLVIHHTS